jgi:uncharacterized membrane protein YeaQ/YmgE (transglycosylase-associated protein family)
MIKCTVCPFIWERIKNCFLDTKKIFTPLFFENKYYLEIGLYFILTIPVILFMMFYTHLADTGLFFQIFVGSFGAFWFSSVVEWYKGKYYNKTYDGTSINMGGYGGILGSLVAIFIYSLI